MLDRVIYFPYINVPEDQWFTRVLLYWDTVGVIIPSDFIRNQEKLTPYTKKLIEVKLIQPLQPGDYISKIPNFENSFLEMIEKERISEHRLEAKNTIKIHIEKFGYELAKELQKKGLARPLNYPWYEMDITTGNLFMAYLALVLGKLEDLNMEPITDKIDHLTILFNYSKLYTYKTRIETIENILPAPASIQVHELAKFKEKHRELLFKFRRHIESSLINISSIQEEDLRNEKLKLFKEEIKEELSEIQSLMKEKRWEIISGTVLGVLTLIPPIISSSGIQGIIATIPNLIYAIYNALNQKSNLLKTLMNSPLAYAMLVQKHLIK